MAQTVFDSTQTKAKEVKTPGLSSSISSQPLTNPKVTFSFAAAGWLQMYHFGVAKALQDTGIVDNENIRFCGSSAGALAAAAIVCECDFDDLKEYAIKCSITARSAIPNAFLLREYVLQGVQLFAVNKLRERPELKYKLCRQLEAYATVLPWCRKKVIGVFTCEEDLKEALAASCCLTPLAGWPFQLRETGEWVCDGGMSAFQPRKGEKNCITVSPIYCTSADIRPLTFLPIWWGLYPPSEKKYRQMYDLAYNDAIQYLVETKRVPPSAVKLLKPKAIRAAERPTLFSFFKDFVIVVFFLFVLRPWAMIFIYLEIMMYGRYCVAKGSWEEFLEFFHHFGIAFRKERRSRAERWSGLYHSFRNLVSARTMIHVSWFGRKVPINKKRLEKSSRLYRVLAPLIYG